MNRYQEEIYKTIDILTDKKIKEAKFDITKQGRVISVDGDTCKVRIHDQEYTCKIRRGIFVKPGDIVYVTFPQNSNVDRYVDIVLGGNEELLPPIEKLQADIQSIKQDIQIIQDEIQELRSSINEIISIISGGS